MQQTENLAPHVQEIARALQNRMEPDAIEDELRRYLDYGVPLAQAKKDIVRMHGGTLVAGAKKLAEVQPEEKGLEFTARVLTVNPKEITVKGQQKQIFYGYLADATAKVPYTAWKPFETMQKGATVHVENAYAKKGFRDPVEISLGDYTTVAVSNEQIAVKDDFVPSAAQAEGGRISGAERKLADLVDGLTSVTLTARVLSLREKTISTANGQKTLVEGELADETGRAPFSAWEPERVKDVKEGSVVRVRGAYVRAFRGIPQVNFGQYATLEVLPDRTLPNLAELERPAAMDLGKLEARGGATGVAVEGIVLEVKKGSGLIFRCAQEGCNRVLQNRQCAIHPQKQEGIPDLRIKAVLDDGRGAATFFANREATEKLLGKTLAQCQQQARDAMTMDVVHEDLDRLLTAHRVVVTGRATSGEYGLQILADAVDFAPAPDAEAEAEKLLGAVAEILQGVAPQ
ncbi:MAG: replication factor [Thermoplasmata archaeon]|jgi:replication factor A1|nr:replication factor [Thermoplasmata archaeon]